MRKQLFFFSLFTLAACGQNSTQTSESKALVSQQQAAEAFAIVKDIDYLPFTYIVDGCYARSLYMSLELAAEKIPSSAHYVLGYLQPTQAVTWSYHVAPLLQLKDSTQEPWIIDPAFETGPLTRTKWIEKNFAASDEELGSRADNTTTLIRAGSAYFDVNRRATRYETKETSLFTVATDSWGDVVKLTPRPIEKAKLVSDFAAMPSFLSNEIHSACTVMHKYIDAEYPKAAVDASQKSLRDAKIARLLASTTRLVQAMDEVGKLSRTGLSGSDGNPYYRDEVLTKRYHAQDCANAMYGYYR